MTAQRIESIYSDRRNPDLQVVRFEDGTRLRIPVAVIEEFGLRAGLVVDDPVRTQLVSSAELLDCRNRAIRLLGVRPRSEEELRTRLVRADFSHPAILSTMTALIDEGLVDDEAFSLQFAEERRRVRRQAPARIEHELRARGVERETAHRAAWGAYEDAQRDADALLLDEAMALLRRRAGRYRGLDAVRVRRRMAGVLERAGYPTGVALDAVDALVEELAERGLLAPDRD